MEDSVKLFQPLRGNFQCSNPFAELRRKGCLVAQQHVQGKPAEPPTLHGLGLDSWAA
jgi:hypothetical protein